MTDHPILFSSPMVRALLAGRKTQTRRLVKPQPALNEAGLWRWPDLDQDLVRHLRRFGVAVQTDAEGIIETLTHDPARRLRFAPGDRLWVRETWAVTTIYDGMRAAEINPEGIPLYCGIRYAATQERLGIKDRPSIHMPRWASRLTLIVTEVRAQRLQEISEADAFAEGAGPELCADLNLCGGHDEGLCAAVAIGPRDMFHDLWDSLHGAGAWDANPWVAAIGFKVQRRNIDAIEPEGAAS